MCGLFGWQFFEECPEINRHTLAAVLAFSANRRGDESWGVSLYTEGDTEVRVQKNVGSIRDTCRIADILASQVMGHTRKATVGAISQDNAHPYVVGTIVGMHNGSVSNYNELNTQYNRTCEVDSMQIFEHLNAGLGLSELSASGTVTYLKTDDPSTVYFGRGDYSDLAVLGIGTIEACRGIVWGSLEAWGKEALDMAGCKEYFTWDTKPLTLYSTSLTDRALMDCGNFLLQPIHTSAVFNYDESPYRPYWRERNVLNTEAYWQEKQRGYYTQYGKKSLDLPDIKPSISNIVPSEFVSQCDACNMWGSNADDYTSDANALVHHTSIGQRLCFQCSAFWGQTARESPIPDQPITVPELRLKAG